MTRHQYTKNIQSELRKLNERIDYKILRGFQYADDSRRHKMLLARIRKQKKVGFFGRITSSLFKFQTI